MPMWPPLIREVPHGGGDRRAPRRAEYSGPVAAFAYSRCARGPVSCRGPRRPVALRRLPRRLDLAAGAWDTPFGPVAVDRGPCRGDRGRVARSSSVRASAHGREHSLEMQLPFVARLLPGVPIVPLVMGHQDRNGGRAGRALGAALAMYAGSAVSSPLAPAPAMACCSSRAAISRTTRTRDGRARWTRWSSAHVEALDPDGLMAALEREPGMRAAGADGGGAARRPSAWRVPGARAAATPIPAMCPATSRRWSATWPRRLVAGSGSRCSRTPIDDGCFSWRGVRSRHACADEPRPGRDRGGRSTSACGAFVTIHAAASCADASAASTPTHRSPTPSGTSRPSSPIRSPLPARAARGAPASRRSRSRCSTAEREVTSVDEIEIGRHGLIVEHGSRRGLLLPQVPVEHGWDRETFLAHTCLKAGLSPERVANAELGLRVRSGGVRRGAALI